MIHVIDIHEHTYIHNEGVNYILNNKYLYKLFINDYTVEPLLKDTPNKGHNTFYLSVKDKFCCPYSIMAIQSYLFKRTTSL